MYVSRRTPVVVSGRVGLPAMLLLVCKYYVSYDVGTLQRFGSELE